MRFPSIDVPTCAIVTQTQLGNVVLYMTLCKVYYYIPMRNYPWISLVRVVGSIYIFYLCIIISCQCRLIGSEITLPRDNLFLIFRCMMLTWRTPFSCVIPWDPYRVITILRWLYAESPAERPFGSIIKHSFK